MGILIRSVDAIAKKWKDVTPRRANIYAENVANPLRNWEDETLAASDRQKEGMREALNEDRIAKGVARVGQAKWSKNTVAKGPQRWSEGVRIAEPDYKAGFAPYHAVISGTTLPPRYAKGDPRNWDRSRVLGLALNEKKRSGV